MKTKTPSPDYQSARDLVSWGIKQGLLTPTYDTEPDEGPAVRGAIEKAIRLSEGRRHHREHSSHYDLGHDREDPEAEVEEDGDPEEDEGSDEEEESLT